LSSFENYLRLKVSYPQPENSFGKEVICYNIFLLGKLTGYPQPKTAKNNKNKGQKKVKKDINIMEDKQKVIVVNNLNKYQHYKDRHIIWIKLYVDILQDYKFCQLDDKERWLFIGLMLLGVKCDNKIPFDVPFVAKSVLFVPRLHSRCITLTLKRIQKLEKLELISIKLLSSCYQDAILDKNVDKKRKESAINFFPYRKMKDVLKDKLGW